jgi:S1-C subfamily serine protease
MINGKKAFVSATFLILLVMMDLPAQAQQIRDLFRTVNPSVVMIRTRQRAVLAQEEGSEGLGSGFLVSADGKIMTAAHVVNQADAIEVVFLSGEIIPARVITSVTIADVALLQLARMPANPVVARLGDSDLVEVGDQIFLIGAPFGISHSLSVGYISARHNPGNVLENLTALDVLQTDASIYSGNSGGPMFNLQGEVVGIVSHVLVRGGNTDGLGFASTSKIARQLMLEERHFWTGIEAYLLEGPAAAVFNVPQGVGLLVQSVAAGSPAEKLGLREGQLKAIIQDQTLMVGGDIILEIAGNPIRPSVAEFQEVQKQLNKLKPGETVHFKVLRAGKILDLTTVVPPE